MLGWFFQLFNFLFGVGTSAYAWVIGRMMRMSVVVLVIYGLLMVLTYFTFSSAPVGFVPQQDQGRLICSIQLPDSSSLQRTQAAVKQVAEIADKTPGRCAHRGHIGVVVCVAGHEPELRLDVHRAQAV